MGGGLGRLGKARSGSQTAGKARGRPAIRIGIVDDHPVFRMGLKRALERERDLEVLWELPSATNLEASMRRTPVDLILMDLFMGRGKDGVAATRELTEQWPRVKVIVISASVDDSGVIASARAGAEGFLPKDMPVSDMVSSIRRLAGSDGSGRRATGDLMETVRRGSRGKSASRGRRPAGGIEALSPRLRQVLEELRLGRTNREIAERLNISIGTVNKHVHQVLTVLKVRNRTQAAAAAGRETG
jgi:DNA-binding NarL/FixJ family response regulator